MGAWVPPTAALPAWRHLSRSAPIMFSHGLRPLTGLAPREGGGPPRTGAAPGGTGPGVCDGVTAGACDGVTLGVVWPGWVCASAVPARNDNATLSCLSMVGNSFDRGAAAQPGQGFLERRHERALPPPASEQTHDARLHAAARHCLR